MKVAKLRNKDVTCSDRISHLPDDLLFRILSFIPITDAMSTSFMSKRWKSVWKMMPTLEYDEKSCTNIGSFALQLHEAPVLKTLKVTLSAPYDPTYSLILPSIRSTLLEITVTNTTTQCNYISFPRNLRIFQTLVVLKLKYMTLKDTVYPPVCFRSLKSLHLTCVHYLPNKPFSRFLSACPVLEDLIIGIFNTHSGMFIISVPSLQRLSIDHVFPSDLPRFEINTPSLKYLKIAGDKALTKFVEDMPNLVEAHVEVVHSETYKLLRSLTSVERLSIRLVSDSLMACLTDTTYNRLLHLELYFPTKLEWNVVLSFLQHSPSLQTLKLNQKPNKNQPSSVPEWLPLHRETLQWLGLAGPPEKKETAGYILKNARRLNVAGRAQCFFSRSSRHHQKKDIMIMKELVSISKASTSCHFQVQLLD